MGKKIKSETDPILRPRHKARKGVARPPSPEEEKIVPRRPTSTMKLEERKRASYFFQQPQKEIKQKQKIQSLIIQNQSLQPAQDFFTRNPQPSTPQVLSFRGFHLFSSLPLPSELSHCSPLVNSRLSLYHDVSIVDPDQTNIDPFRSMVSDHCLKHILKHSKGTKEKGFTNMRCLWLCGFQGDALGVVDKFLEKGWKTFNQGKLRERLYSQQDFQNDDFLIPVKFDQRQNTIKFFSLLTRCHLLVASPLALKRVLETDGPSFLSSVQILIVERAHCLFQQNWEWTLDILDNLNKMPDHSKIQNSIQQIHDIYLDQRSQLFRQNIVYSQHRFIETQPFERHNKLVIVPPVVSLLREGLQFIRFQSKGLQDFQSRLRCFNSRVWNLIGENDAFKKVVVMVNNYADFLRLKIKLQDNQQVDFISEFTQKKVIQSKLSKFNISKIRVLVLTERAYFFSKCPIRDYRHIIFYGLPYNSFIFKQLVESKEEGRCISLLSDSDYWLARGVCGERVEQIMSESNRLCHIVV